VSHHASIVIDDFDRFFYAARTRRGFNAAMTWRTPIIRFSDRERGSSAVEFAIVAPVFLLMVLGIIGYGAYLAMVHDVQQLAAEAARASVAGMSDGERAALAQSAIAAGVGSYPLIAPARLSLDAAATDAATGTFTLTLRYDAGDSFIYTLPYIPMPSRTIVRSAAIQRGGY